MATWTQIDAKLNVFLGVESEAGGEELASIPLRVNAWNWAQQVFCLHTPRQRVMTLVIDSDGRSAVLPSDLYAIDMIYDSVDERYWKPMARHPQDVRYTDDDMLEYWVWGNVLYLEKELDVDDDRLTLYYWAYWPEVTYTGTGTSEAVQQDQIITPQWAELALVHLTAANCLMPLEIFAADINQYKIRVESGNPEHNPRAQSALYHLNWYDALLAKRTSPLLGRER